VSTKAHTRGRLDFVDAHRGLAVVLMLWMHTADGWLRPELKQGGAWGIVRSLGGLAAPSFLLLAGLSLGLGWHEAERPGQRRATVARGLQLMILGYGLRLQMWLLDAGGYRDSRAWVAALLIAGSYWAIYRELGAWARATAGTRKLTTLALLAGVAGLLIVSHAIPSRLLPLLRVDVLQAIGASIALLALLREPLRRRPLLAFALAAVIAALTPWFRAWVPGPLPAPLAAYLGAWEAPPGQPAAALFPLFPWAAYAFVGTGVGSYLIGRELRAPGGAVRAALQLAIAGAALALLTCEALPHAHHALARWPLLTHPARVAYRVGASLILGGLGVALSRSWSPCRAPLLALGRASLFVYWVHLELAFGAVAKPLAHRLDFESWALGLALLTVLMSALSPLWLKLRARLSPKRSAGSQSSDSGSDAAPLPSA
jgi:uncharacterized membrane protein